MDFDFAIEDPKNLGISDDEILLHSLFAAGPFNKDGLHRYTGTHKGREFVIIYNHTTHSRGGLMFGGGLVHGHSYEVKIAAQLGGRLYDAAVHYSTGTHGQVIDNLLHDLYWHADSEFHTRSVQAILNS